MEAALDEVIVRTDDFRDRGALAAITRRRLSRSACSAGCRSSCTPPTAPRVRSTCSRSSPNAFDGEAETIGTVLAAHAAAAILASRRGRGAAVGAVHPRPHRPGQGHHHGALRRRRHSRLRDAAPAFAGQQYPASRYRSTGHRHPRLPIDAHPAESAVCARHPAQRTGSCWRASDCSWCSSAA